MACEEKIFSRRQGFKRIKLCDSEDVKETEENLPTKTVKSVLNSPTPVFNVRVKLTGVSPSLKNPVRFVRGHCPHFACNAVIPIIDWAKSGPSNFGKLLRPFCPNCVKTNHKTYLDLYFDLELIVKDSSKGKLNIIVRRENAVKFLGCSVYNFLTDKGLQSYIVGLMECLIKKCNPDTLCDKSAMTIDLCVVPNISNNPNDIAFHLFGDNFTLYALATKTF